MTKIEQLRAEIRALQHALQSGVAYEMQRDPTAVRPKLLRVNLDAVLCDHRALVGLLIKKGVIGEQEYFEASRDALHEEISRYDKRLSALYGANVKLG